MKRVCIIGASGKLGKYMVRHALDKGYEVVGVCREKSIKKLDEFKGRISIVSGATNDHETIKKAITGCVGVLTVLVPWGVHQYSSGTVQAVFDNAQEEARLIFSCGWHITQDGKDIYSKSFKRMLGFVSWIGKLFRLIEIKDQEKACELIFASDTKWTVVRGSDLEEGESQGLPVWSDHVGDSILKSNMTRRVDFALFMVEALENDKLNKKSPAIVGCQTHSALAHHSNRKEKNETMD
ncbi:MAG: NAD(P)H-binding protein [Cytophagales bacterium]|nr:NAD(P)H-binding protein [Cytophagales bacterium]